MLGWFAFLVTTLFELEGDNNGHAPQVARSRLQRNDEHPAKPGCTKSPRRHSCGCCGRNEGGPCAGRPTWFASSSHRPAQPGRIPTAAPQLSAINRARRNDSTQPLPKPHEPRFQRSWRIGPFSRALRPRPDTSSNRCETTNGPCKSIHFGSRRDRPYASPCWRSECSCWDGLRNNRPPMQRNRRWTPPRQTEHPPPQGSFE